MNRYFWCSIVLLDFTFTFGLSGNTPSAHETVINSAQCACFTRLVKRIFNRDKSTHTTRLLRIMYWTF